MLFFSSIMSSQQLFGSGDMSVKWVNPPDQRGTIDIIRGCFIIFSLSLWVILHLNVPARDEGFWSFLLRKARWLSLSGLAPETVLLASGGQWASAKRSLNDLRALGLEQWTLTHAVYADSGGLLLQRRDFSPFPVTTKQIHYVVMNKHIALPDITKNDILDKSKADILGTL